MYRLYKKNELYFSLAWIIAYVLLLSSADRISASLGIMKVVTAPVSIVISLLLIGFLKKHRLLQRYGLCAFKGRLKDYLFFLPLLVIMSVNLWNGVTRNAPALETVLFILSMVCVGLIEEVIFRGFLFKALCRDNVRLAVIISSITFGLGHIVNLLNGRELLLTLLQICYAAAIGFLFTVIFCKGKSLLPCIAAHSVVNSLSIFAVSSSSFIRDAISAGLLCIVSSAYAVWLLRKA